MFVLVEAHPANHATELRTPPDVSANIGGDVTVQAVLVDLSHRVSPNSMLMGNESPFAQIIKKLELDSSAWEEPKVEARTVQRSFEPRYSTSGSTPRWAAAQTEQASRTITIRASEWHSRVRSKQERSLEPVPRSADPRTARSSDRTRIFRSTLKPADRRALGQPA